MVNLKTRLIPLLEVPLHLPPSPRTGRAVHRATLFRWIQIGVHGVRLKPTRIGGATYVAQEDLEDFIERTSARVPAA